MACLSHAVDQTMEHAYAHHIQRLMITGNFALLAGIDPDEVDAWYLGVYIDALEWVEITNTRGMSQFADGGIVGSKPYVSSAQYIKKMGPYCKGCHYKANEKVGEQALPISTHCIGIFTPVTGRHWSAIRALEWSTEHGIGWMPRSRQPCSPQPK